MIAFETAIAKARKAACQLKHDRVLGQPPESEPGVLMIVRVPAACYNAKPQDMKQCAIALMLDETLTEEHFDSRLKNALLDLEGGIIQQFPNEREERQKLIEELSS